MTCNQVCQLRKHNVFILLDADTDIDTLTEKPNTKEYFPHSSYLPQTHLQLLQTSNFSPQSSSCNISHTGESLSTWNVASAPLYTTVSSASIPTAMPKLGLILSMKPHVSDFDFYAKNHPFLLGMYIFFLCFLLITSTLIFLGQEDPQEQEDSVFETPSKQHELISKRMSKGGWPQGLLPCCSTGWDREEEGEEGENQQARRGMIQGVDGGRDAEKWTSSDDSMLQGRQS